MLLNFHQCTLLQPPTSISTHTRAANFPWQQSKNPLRPWNLQTLKLGSGSLKVVSLQLLKPQQRVNHCLGRFPEFSSGPQRMTNSANVSWSEWNTDSNSFGRHAFHLEVKVEVISAEGSLSNYRPWSPKTLNHTAKTSLILTTSHVWTKNKKECIMKNNSL